jgi:opacity protein-like surface antigen
MKKILISLTTVLALTTTTYAGGSVVPQEAEVVPVPAVISPIPLYVGLGVVAAAVSRDCPCMDGSRLKDMTYGGLLRAGWDFNDYIGIEARALQASIEEDFSETTHYGLYLKPQYHVSNQTNIYGLIGYGKTEVDYDNHRGRASTLSESGLSYGAGIEYDLSSDNAEGEYARTFDGQGNQEKGLGIFADYQHLLSDEGEFNTDSNIFTVGLTYDF